MVEIHEYSQSIDIPSRLIVLTSFPKIIYALADFLGGTALFPRSLSFYMAL
jgi:hypothetical protein